MPALHLSKVAFGCRDVEALQARVRARASNGELRVATRMRPRRAQELIGGNLYWIVRHRIVGCNAILGFEDRDDGRIDIVCSAEFTPIAPRHCRALPGRWGCAQCGRRRQRPFGPAAAPLRAP